MVPWWHSAQLYARAKETLTDEQVAALSTDRRRLSVRVEGIEDWCIDYTYPNPSLWLIASSGVWYRVAGCLMAGLGGHRGTPAPSYEPLFAKTRKAFLASVHVAMCLIDFLPSSPKMTLAFMTDEVVARAGGDLDDLDLLEHHSLIAEQVNPRIIRGSIYIAPKRRLVSDPYLMATAEQVGALERPADWNHKVPAFASCAFVTQLKKEGKVYAAGGGRASYLRLKQNGTADSVGSGAAAAAGFDAGTSARGRKRKSTVEQFGKKQAAAVFTAQAFRTRPLSAVLVGEDGEREAPDGSAPFLDVAHMKQPVDDAVYWAAVLSQGGEMRPPPVPRPSTRRASSALCAQPALSACPQHLGRLLGAWTTINNFRGFFSARVLGPVYITLDALEASLCESRPVAHPLLRELHASMLAVLLLSMDRDELKAVKVATRAGATSVLGMAAALVLGASVSAPLDGRHVEAAVDSAHRDKLQALLVVGDAWVEVLRLLLAARSVPPQDNADAAAAADTGAPAGRNQLVRAPLPLAPAEGTVGAVVALPDYWDALEECANVLDTVLVSMDAAAKAALTTHQQSQQNGRAGGSSSSSGGANGRNSIGSGAGWLRQTAGAGAAAAAGTDGMALALAADQLHDIIVALQKGAYDDPRIGDGDGDGCTNDDTTAARLQRLADDARAVFQRAEEALAEAEGAEDHADAVRGFRKSFDALFDAHVVKGLRSRRPDQWMDVPQATALALARDGPAGGSRGRSSAAASALAVASAAPTADFLALPSSQGHKLKVRGLMG